MDSNSNSFRFKRGKFLDCKSLVKLPWVDALSLSTDLDLVHTKVLAIVSANAVSG